MKRPATIRRPGLGFCTGWLAVAFLASPAATAETPDGQALYVQKACASCHGEAGREPLPTYPRLDGQDEAYLIRQMTDIKSGERNNGNSALMAGYMKTVSAGEIAAIAAYLARIPHRPPVATVP